MTENQWKELGEIVKGKSSGPLQTGFIVDSPWLPKWFGVKILDYFTNDDIWLKANLHVINTFPDAMFLPGFWSEYGMCSEPSAFGSRCSFPANEFPHAHRVIHSIDDISRLSKPDPEKDGLAPFILNRLLINQQKIEDAGHKIYFSVSRGPLNIASYLMGTTEFMTAMITHPEEIHSLLQLINNYLIDIHEIQMQAIPSIDGILILDDLIGFIGEEEFREFGLPYFKQLFNRDVSIKFLHNDASWISSIAYMNEIGINLFNMGFEPNLNELKELTDHQVTMLGNIPPRDVLANGSVLDIEKAVKELIQKLDRRDRVIVSCGGGMPPNVSTENINCFIEMVQKYGH
jgi:uroporphyrinogen-III decarboxylase